MLSVSLSQSDMFFSQACCDVLPVDAQHFLNSIFISFFIFPRTSASSSCCPSTSLVYFSSKGDIVFPIRNPIQTSSLTMCTIMLMFGVLGVSLQQIFVLTSPAQPPFFPMERCLRCVYCTIYRHRRPASCFSESRQPYICNNPW